MNQVPDQAISYFNGQLKRPETKLEVYYLFHACWIDDCCMFMCTCEPCRKWGRQLYFFNLAVTACCYDSSLLHRQFTAMTACPPIFSLTSFLPLHLTYHLIALSIYHESTPLKIGACRSKQPNRTFIHYKVSKSGDSSFSSA